MFPVLRQMGSVGRIMVLVWVCAGRPRGLLGQAAGRAGYADRSAHAFGLYITNALYQRYGGPDAYRAFAQQQLNFTLGANAWAARSWSGRAAAVGYEDNVVSWPSVEPADDYTAASLLAFALGAAGNGRPGPTR